MNRLSKKEKGFVKDIVKGKTQVEAGLNNYDTKDYMTASAIASENLKKPKIIEAIKTLAERIPDELLEKVHLEGLEAGKKVFKNNNETGEIEMVSEEPDYAVRHKYLDSAYKLKGIYAPDKSVNLNLNGDITPNEEIEALAKQLNEIARSNNRTSVSSDGANPDTVDKKTQD